MSSGNLRKLHEAEQAARAMLEQTILMVGDTELPSLRELAAEDDAGGWTGIDRSEGLGDLLSDLKRWEGAVAAWLREREETNERRRDQRAAKKAVA